MARMAEPRRWFDPSQPQTLQIAVMLGYVIAAFALLFLLFGALPDPISIGMGVASYGVANEKRWAYWLGVILGSVNVLFGLLILKWTGFTIAPLVNLAFMVALLALFLHPQSREYQRVWFR